MAYRLARALEALRNEIDTQFPARSKASDGWIGDAAHASRDSDHNPWFTYAGVGIVTATDTTGWHAPDVGDIADLIVDTLVKRRDRRVKYIIHKRRIWRSYDKPGIPAWTPSAYTGSNPHDKHVHVSVNPQVMYFDSTAPWGIAAAVKRARRKERLLTVGDTGLRVRSLQWWLNRRGFTAGPIDGQFGALTKAAVERAERALGRKVDGVAGPPLLRALKKYKPEEPPKPEATGGVIVATLHAPPYRFRRLWGTFDANLRRFIGSKKPPLLIVGDFNRGVDTAPKILGVHKSRFVVQSGGERILWAAVDRRLTLGKVSRLGVGRSDHSPLRVDLTVDGHDVTVVYMNVNMHAPKSAVAADVGAVAALPEVDVLAFAELVHDVRPMLPPGWAVHQNLHPKGWRRPMGTTSAAVAWRTSTVSLHGRAGWHLGVGPVPGVKMHQRLIGWAHLAPVTAKKR